MGVKKILAYGFGAAALGGAVFVGGSYAIHSNPIMAGAMLLNTIRAIGLGEPTIEVEVKQPATVQPVALTDTSKDWPSFNRTVSSERFSPLKEITTENAGELKVLCTYDTNRFEGNQTGLLMVEGALIGTTIKDVFSINPDTCAENWRVSASNGIGIMPANRGVGYDNGMLYRGFSDGYVRAYDARTGIKIWETFIADKDRSIWLTAAAIASDGMVYYGMAGGDIKDIRGRIVALDGKTGKLIWQTYTVPKSDDDPTLAPLGKMPTDEMAKSWQNPPDVPISGGGMWTSFTLDPETGYLYLPIGNPAPDFVKSLRPGSNLFTNTILVLDAKTGDYVKHYSIMPDDWHDWDVSNTPTLFTSRAGRKLMSFHPKDGHLYSFDRTTDENLYRNPVTKIENADAPFEVGKPVHFCPGSVGGGEWNSAAYDPNTNLLFTGENQWCTTATIQSDKTVTEYADGMIWFGQSGLNPFDMAGQQQKNTQWGGWLYASDADSGEWAWRARTNYPIVAAVTPTAGGIVAFGDMGGAFYVMDASSGKQLWTHNFKGGIAGGVISYATDAGQRIALTYGFAHPQWPVRPRSGKIAVLGIK